MDQPFAPFTILSPKVNIYCFGDLYQQSQGLPGSFRPFIWSHYLMMFSQEKLFYFQTSHLVSLLYIPLKEIYILFWGFASAKPRTLPEFLDHSFGPLTRQYSRKRNYIVLDQSLGPLNIQCLNKRYCFRPYFLVSLLGTVLIREITLFQTGHLVKLIYNSLRKDIVFGICIKNA